MTRDEIIERMNWSQSANQTMPDILDRLEKLVRASERVEREACAKVCEQYAHADPLGVSIECAAAIRARGQA